MTPHNALELFVSNQFANETWMLSGLCVNEDPEWWFPTPGEEAKVRHAVRICRECPVRARCLEWALKTDSAYGIYGATTEAQRKQLKENGHAG